MTTTVAEIVSAAQSVNAFVDSLNTRLTSVTNQLNTLINTTPLPANALDTYNDLVQERDDIANDWNNYQGYSSLVNLITTAPTSVQQSQEVFNIFYGQNGTRNKVTIFTNAAKNQKNTLFPQAKTRIETALAEASNGDPAGTGQGGNSGAGGNENGADDDAGGTLSLPPAATDGSTPGRRLKNPLGWFSSYTYNITWAMVSPVGYAEFLANGKIALPSAGQYYIIAQSGGINRNERAPTNPYDFYIDNVRMNSAIGQSETGTETFQQNIDFTITEPYGFSLPTKLQEAGTELKRNSEGVTGSNFDQITNDVKQIFIIGIRFLGYDSEGNILNGANIYEDRTLDPTFNASTSRGVFEKFFDVNLTDFQFKIDGKATRYEIKTAGLPAQAALGIKRGFLDSNLKAEGATVEDMLAALMNKLNADQEKRKADGDILQTNNYSIDWSSPGADFIRRASMVLPEQKDKSKTATNPAANIQDVNAAQSEKSAPNLTTVIEQFNRDTPIVQIISKVIARSSYLRDSQTIAIDNITEPNQYDQSDNENRPDTKKRAQWFNCSPFISNPRFDTKTKDWAYDIKYIIKPYETPFILSGYVNPGANYYGPFKRYDYWYTGKNSEIISYEQHINNSFFTVATNFVDGTGQQTGGDNQVSTAQGKKTNADNSSAVDKQNQAPNSYLTSLADEASFSAAKVTILGDPDYLMQPTETDKDLGENYRKWYGVDGYTINPTSGQVFVEIDFKEPIDYDTQKGYMSINDKILFVKYPDWFKTQVQGVSYLVKGLTSTFNNGKFTQVLDLTLNIPPETPPSGSTTT